ncbi:MAG: cysteine-rich CWC family protein, partial [Anaerolineae bacterium]|nr:cysteine-rich CWC family protein [Anaerolineae bacterium]
FTCGLSAHQEKCWCFDRPHVIEMTDASREGCLCPACLDKQIAAIQARDKKANV